MTWILLPGGKTVSEIPCKVYTAGCRVGKHGRVSEAGIGESKGGSGCRGHYYENRNPVKAGADFNIISRRGCD